MKINLKPVGDFVGEGRVYRVRSSSNPFLWHFVLLKEKDCDTCEAGCMFYRSQDQVDIQLHDCSEYPCPAKCDHGKVYEAVCSCTGYNTHGHCWHTDDVKEWDDGIKPDQTESDATQE